MDGGVLGGVQPLFGALSDRTVSRFGRRLPWTVGFGVYTSVDFALLNEVLPQAVDRGKDLGGYRVLYLVAAGFALGGAVLVYRIRSVR